MLQLTGRGQQYERNKEIKIQIIHVVDGGEQCVRAKFHCKMCMLLYSAG